MNAASENPQRIPLFAGVKLWGFLCLWFCAYKPVFQFVGTINAIELKKDINDADIWALYTEIRRDDVLIDENENVFRVRSVEMIWYRSFGSCHTIWELKKQPLMKHYGIE
jgi:hypothetical protein